MLIRYSLVPPLGHLCGSERPQHPTNPSMESELSRLSNRPGQCAVVFLPHSTTDFLGASSAPQWATYLKLQSGMSGCSQLSREKSLVPKCSGKPSGSAKRERKPLSAIAANPCDMPAQLANESFRADHVRFGNSVGVVVQVLMRCDVPAAEAFFRDHLLFDHPSISDATTWTARY